MFITEKEEVTRQEVGAEERTYNQLYTPIFNYRIYLIYLLYYLQFQQNMLSYLLVPTVTMALHLPRSSVHVVSSDVDTDCFVSIRFLHIINPTPQLGVPILYYNKHSLYYDPSCLYTEYVQIGPAIRGFYLHKYFGKVIFRHLTSR